jgi:hypothetical protein
MGPTPRRWGKAKLDALGSPVVREQVEDLQQYLRSQHKTLIPYLSKTYPKYFKKSKWTLKLLTETALHVWGRAFDTSAQDLTNPTRRTWGMIPFADLVNHGSYIESFYGDDADTSTFSCWASEGFDSNAEIFQSYGSHRSSTHFFLYYGFVATGYLRADYIAFNMDQNLFAQMAAKVPAAKRKLLPKYVALTGFAGIDGHISNAYIRDFRTFLELTGSIPADELAVARGFKYTLQLIFDQITAVIKGFKTSYKENFRALKLPFSTYDKWVTTTFQSRYKYIFDKVKTNVDFRMKHDPAGSETKEKHGWMEEPYEGLLVYDASEVNTASAAKCIKDSMFLVQVNPPIEKGSKRKK